MIAAAFVATEWLVFLVITREASASNLDPRIFILAYPFRDFSWSLMKIPGWFLKLGNKRFSRHSFQFIHH